MGQKEEEVMAINETLIGLDRMMSLPFSRQTR